MTPALISGFSVPPMIAVGTDLAFAAITKGAGVASHRNSGSIQWPIVAWMVGGSIPACLLALWWLPAGSPTWIKPIIGVALLGTALSIIFRERIAAWAQKHRPTQVNTDLATRIHPRPLPTLLLSGTIGALVAYSSIGAGAIGCTLLALLYPRMNAKDIAATDIAYAVPLTTVAAIGHGLKGNIDSELLLALLVGSVPAIYVGVRLTRKLEAKVTRGVLATVLSIAAAKSFL
jgi:uncharacterized protein